MELQLYDTLARRKRPFAPIDPERVRMYVCGPTVYDYAHIGNARPVIVFDVLFRLLRHLYGPEHVTYVRNITDVDDKINARAAERGIEIRQLTEETYANFKADVTALGCLPPTVEPRATEHIGEMKTLIERLVANNCAYVAEGHVLFHVAAMKDYGKLSNRSLDEMVAGARVEVAPYKKDPMDFVLWKPSKQGEPGWPSPCGIATPGRPGWHIECSAMSWKHLGETFDIHGGGIDLVFPHHENEIAQSRCAFHTGVMANYWMHNGFLQVEGEKMSKSLGNFVTIREALTNWKGQSWSGRAIRLAMLETSYRQPINWTLEKVRQADQELFRFSGEVFSVIANCFDNNVLKFSDYMRDNSTPVPSSVVEALCDDLNTSAALTAVRQLYDKMGKNPSTALQAIAAFEFLGLINIDSVLLASPPALRNVFDVNEVHKLFSVGRNFVTAVSNKDFQIADCIRRDLKSEKIEVKHLGLGMFLFEKEKSDVGDGIKERIERLISMRATARKAKDFKESDRIRDELAAMSVVLKDGKDPETGEPVTTWEIAR